MGEHLYTDIWKKALPPLIALLETGMTDAGNALTEANFQSVGARKDYTFRLEIEDGIVMNNIDGSAVSRDLADVFLTNPEAVALSYKYRVVLRLLRNFELKGTLVTKTGTN